MKKEVILYDTGYPWGVVAIPKGYYVREIPASCEGECEEKGAASTGHFACTPGWRKNVEEKGGIVLDTQFLDGDWKALVAFPLPTIKEEIEPIVSEIIFPLSPERLDTIRKEIKKISIEPYYWVCLPETVCDKNSLVIEAVYDDDPDDTDWWVIVWLKKMKSGKVTTKWLEKLPAK